MINPREGSTIWKGLSEDARAAKDLILEYYRPTDTSILVEIGRVRRETGCTLEEAIFALLKEIEDEKV